MAEGIEALQFRRNGGETVRFHSFRRIVENRVGHHSYNVAQILRYLMDGYGYVGERRAVLLEAALDHDIAEWVTGDMPAPTKRSLPAYDCGEDRGIPTQSFREVYAEHEAAVMAKAGIADVSVGLSSKSKRLLKLADSLDGMWQCVDERKYGNASNENRDCFLAFASYVRELMGISEAHRMIGDKRPEGQVYSYIYSEMERFL